MKEKYTRLIIAHTINLKGSRASTMFLKVPQFVSYELLRLTFTIPVFVNIVGSYI